MATIVQDCPRCRAKMMTFDIRADTHVGRRYDWQNIFEIYAVCRSCGRPSIMRISEVEFDRRTPFTDSGRICSVDLDLAGIFAFEYVITAADQAGLEAPSDLPAQIANIFDEGTRCLKIGCYNAAGTMFRLCLDLATEALLPAEDVEGGPNKHQRRNLAPRLAWLFENGCLPEDLKDLSDAVKANGDDGAHRGALDESEAQDIYDFAFALLDRLYSQPARLAAAALRRAQRRSAEQP